MALTHDGTLSAVSVNATTEYQVGGTKVVGEQQSAIGDIQDTSGSANDGGARTKINSILSMLRTHGLIAA